jgi:hypothetical protein
MSAPGAKPADVSTLEGIIGAAYEVISGPAGQARDWARFRSLYAEGARLMPIVRAPGEAARVRVLTPDEYIRRVEPIFAAEDFWERECGRETQTFGHVAHVLSRYESRRSPEGEPFERGTNSMQLFHDGARWWIVSVMWNTSRHE